MVAEAIDLGASRGCALDRARWPAKLVVPVSLPVRAMRCSIDGCGRETSKNQGDRDPDCTVQSLLG